MKFGKKIQTMIQLITKLEWKMFYALLTLVSLVAKIGKRLWNKSEKSSVCNNIHFTEFMKELRFKSIKSVLIMKNDDAKVYDDWWRFSKQNE